MDQINSTSHAQIGHHHKYLRYFLGTMGAILLFSGLIGVNLLQMLSLAIRPFSPKTFRRLNRYFAESWWGASVRYLKDVQKMEVKFSGDEIPAEENALIIPNHQSMADIVFLLAFGKEYGHLAKLNWFVKDPLKYCPGPGWGMWFLDCIFVKRNWSRDKLMIEATFNKIKANHIPIWLVSFLEGTRLTPGKLLAGQKFAVKNNLPKFHHVLVPRTKGLFAAIQGLGGHLNAIYDVTIGYLGKAPTLWEVIIGKTRPVHVHIRRFSIETLPRKEEEIGKWIMEVFRDKDRLLTGLQETGKFQLESAQLGIDSMT